MIEIYKNANWYMQYLLYALITLFLSLFKKSETTHQVYGYTKIYKFEFRKRLNKYEGFSRSSPHGIL